MWNHLGLPAPTAIQYDMAWYMQHGPDRAVIEAFRGIGKSYTASAFCVWLYYCNPNVNVIVQSASKPRADAFSTFCLRLIDEMDILAHLRPREGQRRSVIAFDVGPARASQTPSMLSIGIFGNATGYRADFVLKDDVEVPNNSETQLQREKLKERTKEAAAILKPGGRILVLGTPQTNDSIYNDYPERGYTIRVWPSEYPDQKVLDERAHELAPMIIAAVTDNPSLAGHSTEPTRFPDEILFQRKLEWGLSGYALQYLLNTRMSDADRLPLRLRDLIVFPLDSRNAPEKVIYAAVPEYVIETAPMVGHKGDRYYRGRIMPDCRFSAYEGTVMYVDPAGRGKDETAYAVVSHLNGTLFLRDSGGLKGYEDPTLVELCNIAKKYAATLVLVEPNFGDGMFTTLLKKHMGAIYPTTVEEAEWQSTQKEKRICDILEPVFNAHRLVVDEQLITKDFESTRDRPPEKAPLYRLFHQITRITRDKGCLAQDDRVDALAGAVRYWTRMMSIEVDDAVKDQRERALMDEIEHFMEHAIGREPQKSNCCANWTE